MSKEPRGKSVWERGLGTKGGVEYNIYLKKYLDNQKIDKKQIKKWVFILILGSFVLISSFSPSNIL